VTAVANQIAVNPFPPLGYRMNVAARRWRLRFAIFDFNVARNF
jgi:hypothetical protein